jgi:macrolide transport system ATP-binding/permease protein
MTFLISAVASISLLVGGIGIMNIMLVSIIERRREIGLRIAVGARQMDILFQFLTEALVICIAGAIIGVSLAIITGWTMVYFVPGIRMIFSIKAILLACGVAIGTGLIFGYLPARNAARLDPVAALERD